MPMVRARSGMTLTLLMAVLGTSCAQQGSSGSSGSQADNMQGMQSMSMQQRMEDCRRMQGMDPAQMTPEMEQKLQECDAMMRSHGPGGAPTP